MAQGAELADATAEFLGNLDAACGQIEMLIRSGKVGDVFHLIESLQHIPAPAGLDEAVTRRTVRLRALLRDAASMRPTSTARVAAPAGPPPYAGAARQVGFIVGTGRCGTTILASVLNAHSKICVPPELSFITKCYGRDLLFEKCLSGEMARFTADDFYRFITEFCPFDLESFIDLRRHFDHLRYPQTNLRHVVLDLFDDLCFTNRKEILIEQTPWYGLELHSLRKLFPEMKVVHMVRDGRDVAISAARTGWWHMGITENLERWAREVNTIRRFGQDHPQGFLEVRYEDLMTAPEGELSRILALFGVALQPAMLDVSNLVNYFDLHKTASANCHSEAYRRWKSQTDRVFFSDSVYAWKKRPATDFRCLSDRVKRTLREYRYDD